MNETILIQINGVAHSFDFTALTVISVKETDEILLAIKFTNGMPPPIFQFEDYEIAPTIVDRADGRYYEIPPKTYLSECFGKAVVRICTDGVTIPLVFDVFAKKTSATQAMRMIKYLANVSTTLIKSCLARSSLPVGAVASDQIEPETLLSSAESIVATLQASRQELVSNCRERLIPMRLPLRAANKLTCEIDPMEVVGNLDALTPAAGVGDVVLRGRNFDLGDIDVSALQSTADVRENHILLGGLYSVRTKIHTLHNLLVEHPKSTDGSPVGYESFSRLLLTITAGGMIQRCVDTISAVDGFIDLFERRLGVTYHGELTPVMTPFVRSTRVYRSLYTQFSDWYAMGSPAFGSIQFMMKMKSLSKIYELFTFYHLLEEILRCGWTLVDEISHPEFGEYMPSSVTFIKDDEKLSIDYEPRIDRYNDKTKNYDLIDVGHRAGADNPYWTPDFVLRLETMGVIRYIILDAKYSTARSVRQYAVPTLYSKYYEGTAVYDATRQIATNMPIIAVLAIYALEWGPGSYISKWDYQGIFSKLPRLPAIGAVGLMSDNDDFFNRTVDRLLELCRLTVDASVAASPPLDTLRLLAA